MIFLSVFSVLDTAVPAGRTCQISTGAVTVSLLMQRKKGDLMKFSNVKFFQPLKIGQHPENKFYRYSLGVRLRGRSPTSPKFLGLLFAPRWFDPERRNLV